MQNPFSHCHSNTSTYRRRHVKIGKHASVFFFASSSTQVIAHPKTRLFTDDTTLIGLYRSCVQVRDNPNNLMIWYLA